MIKKSIKEADGKIHNIAVGVDDTLIEGMHKLNNQIVEQVLNSKLKTYSEGTRCEEEGKALNDRFSVSENQIQENAIVSTNGSLKSRVINIEVDNFKGVIHVFVVTPSTKISTLKLLINERIRTSSEDYILRFHGGTLADWFTLEHYGIRNRDTIIMFPSLEEIQIEVKTFVGSIHLLEITWDKTLTQLKRMIYDKSGIKPEGQILSYSGRTIGESSRDGTDSDRDEVTLEDCKIYDDCTILVLKRLPPCDCHKKHFNN